MVASNDKLVLVTRADLPVGMQAAQVAHALRQFVQEHAQIEREWFAKSNTLVLVKVPDEVALSRLLEHAKCLRIAVSSFREPDLDDEVTALALQPCSATKRLTRNLPLIGASDRACSGPTPFRPDRFEAIC